MNKVRVVSEETRRKLSAASKGQIPYKYGLKNNTYEQIKNFCGVR